MGKDSRWFDGLKFAETYTGERSLESYVEESRHYGDFDEFDQGVLDYISYKEKFLCHSPT